MEKIERLLLKIMFVQLLALLIAQGLLLYSPYAVNLTKVTEYEGVVQQDVPHAVETIDSP